MLSRLVDLLFYGIKLPLLWYLILFVVISAGIIWFGFIYQDQGKDLKQTEDALTDAYEELDAQDEELKELSQGYSTMALMLEDHHAQIVDLQTYSDLLTKRLDILNDRLNVQRESIASLGRQSFHLFVKRVDSDYTGPDDEEDTEEETLPEPLPGWLDQAKGLDSL